MSIYEARTIGGGADAVGTNFPTFRLGLTGPTFYNGSADPTVTPPTPMDDGFSNGDIYIRGTAGGSALWVYDTAVWTQIASGAVGGSFAGDIIMEAGAQLLGDDAADETAPAFAFDGDTDTGMYQEGADELAFSTGGTQAFIMEADGTLASTIAGYESLVLADNDMPNRKYVEDTFINAAGDTMTGDLTFDPGSQIFSASGSAANPGIAMALDPDNGFYLDATDSIGVSSVGARIASFNPDGIQMRNGAQFIGDTATAGVPSISFNGDLTTGIFHDASAGEIALSSSGTETIRFDASTATGTLSWQGGDGVAGAPAISFSGDTNTGFYRLATGTVAYSSDGINVLNISGTLISGSLRWLGPNGTAALPAISFAGDFDSGMFNAGADIVGFSAGTTEVFRIASTNIQALDGLVATPAYSFASEVNTGMFHPIANTLGFVIGGIERLRITTIDARFEKPVRTGATDGDVSAPSFSFTDDDDTGMFRPVANEMGFSAGGTERLRINATGIAVTGAISATAAVTFAITSTASSTLTLDDTHYTVVGTLAGAQIFTLPTAVGIAGRIYNIKKTGASGTLTVDGDGAETIDGAATFAMAAQYDKVTVQSDGANWIII